MRNIITSLLLVSFAFIGCNTNKELVKLNAKETMKNKESINAFYNNALTVNSINRPTKVLTPLLADGYKSSSSTGVKNAEQLMGQLEFFWKLIPDLKWEPQVIHNDGNTYIVRSKASGTPKGEFMGLLTDGTKKFEITTIDMHTMKEGKILATHHVEDWATAMQQLKSGTKKQTAMDIADAYMGAMGKGDMVAMSNLMHEDMVWQNSGDSAIPWINENGLWKGKQTILEKFMPAFGKGFQTIKWEPVDAVTSDDTAAYFGQMIGKLTNTGVDTKEFTYALRVKVKDGKVILWNWFEDSIEVSRAYNGK